MNSATLFQLVATVFTSDANGVVIPSVPSPPGEKDPNKDRLEAERTRAVAAAAGPIASKAFLEMVSSSAHDLASLNLPTAPTVILRALEKVVLAYDAKPSPTTTDRRNLLATLGDRMRTFLGEGGNVDTAQLKGAWKAIADGFTKLAAAPPSWLPPAGQARYAATGVVFVTELDLFK